MEVQIKDGDTSKGRYINPTITDAGYGMVRDSRNNNEEIYSPTNIKSEVTKWLEDKKSNTENRGDLFSTQHSIDITPELKSQVEEGLPLFQKALSSKGIGLQTSGFTFNGDIYLNNEVASSETYIHEFSHIFLDYLKANRPEVYQRGLELVRKELGSRNSEIKDIIEYVSRTQPNLQDESLENELIVEMLGRRGLELINEVKGKKGGIINWAKDVWADIKSMLGISQMSNEELMNLDLEGYARALNVDLLSGERIGAEKNQDTKNNLLNLQKKDNNERFNRQEREILNEGDGILRLIEDELRLYEGEYSEEDVFDKLRSKYKDQGIVLDNIDERLGEEIGNGTESLVWGNPGNKTVIKAMSYDMEGGLSNLIDKIVIHNSIFPETKIDVLGIGKLSDNTNVLIVEQPFVDYNNNIVMTENEIIDFMKSKGFNKITNDDYPVFSNGKYEIKDLHEGNIGITIGGNIGVIDFFADIIREPKIDSESNDIRFQKQELSDEDFIRLIEDNGIVEFDEMCGM
jgi:hypothetical protein